MCIVSLVLVGGCSCVICEQDKCNTTVNLCVGHACVGVLSLGVGRH
jgi:hypothetical protein